MQDQNRAELSRRDFLARAAAGAAAAAGAMSGMGLKLPAALAGKVKKQTGMDYRVLGRTGLKVSELSFGTIRTGNEAVIHWGLDLGINFLDTAECYREGNGEIDLGRALKGRRDRVFVATKWHTDGKTPAADLLKSLDESLQRLSMDHVDIIQIHGAENEAQVNSDELWAAFTTAKQAGKVRFNGLSVHGNHLAIIRAAVKSGRYDTVLPSYNAISTHVGPGVREAREAGLGVIVMKALAPAHRLRKAPARAQGLQRSPYQLSIQWVLADRNVSTIIVDMPTFDELEEDYAALATAMTQAEKEAFEAALARNTASVCHMCGACTGQCPAGVKVADIMRFVLYHDGYGDRDRAVSLYRALSAGASAAACGDCARCQVVCPWGVCVREQLEKAHAALA